MDALVRNWARLLGVGGAAVTILVGIVMGFSLPTLVVRSLAVGAVLYAAVLILGRAVAEAILRVALRKQTGGAIAGEDPAANDAHDSEPPARAA